MERVMGMYPIRYPVAPLNDYGWLGPLVLNNYAHKTYAQFYCPALTPPLEANTIFTNGSLKVTYGRIMEEDLRAHPYADYYVMATIDTKKFRFIHLERIRNNGKTILGGDSYQDSTTWGKNQSQFIYLKSNLSTGAAHARHGGRMNFMFADGHSAALTPQEFKKALEDGDQAYTDAVSCYDAPGVLKSVL